MSAGFGCGTSSRLVRLRDHAGGAGISSNASSASAAYISDGPPPMYTVMPSASSSSARVTPSLTSAWTWKPMHASQWAAMPSASAISSFVFLSRAPSRVAECAIAEKPFIVSGRSARSFESVALFWRVMSV